MATGIELGQSFALMVLVATALVFLARRFRQPSILAYATTGLLLGPLMLDAVSSTQLTSILSELGLVFLLFLIGLEIEIDELAEIIGPVTAITLFQVGFTGLLGYFIASILGFSFIHSLFIGAASSFSSTAVVVKMLSDKDEISSLPGKINVGVLLVQDLIVVLLLALIGSSGGFNSIGFRLLEIVAMVTVVGGVSWASSRYLLPRLFEEIAENRHAFFIHGVAWALVMIFISQELNISSEIGAFFAGIALAQMPYSTELQERVRPLTDFFVAFFFINFGLQLDSGSFYSVIGSAAAFSGVIMTGKFLLTFVAVDRLNFTPETSFKSALNLTQNSEFSLVLAGIGISAGIIGSETGFFLSLVALLTMSLSSYLIGYNSQIYEFFKPWLQSLEGEETREVDIRNLEDHALVVGYDPLARSIIPVLEQKFDDVVVVDNNSANTGELSGADIEYIYGDFSHGEIRRASRLSTASLVVSFSPDHWLNRKIVEDADRDATVFVKAEEMEEAVSLYDEGAHFVILKNLLASSKLGEYMELYLEDRELFNEKVRDELEMIKWGGRDG